MTTNSTETNHPTTTPAGDRPGREGSTMQAIVQDRFGGSEVLELREVPRPVPGEGEVLVRVRAAGVDRGTWHVMAGLPLIARPMFGLRRPRNPTPGRDIAGVVEAVGAGVAAAAGGTAGFAVGDEVYGTADGGFAEWVVTTPGRLAAKPANLTFEQAAAVPVSALTALQAVRDQAEVRPGQSVLVVGASGGVGSFAVQIAKAFGAEVTGVASKGKVDLVRSLGADHVIDYTAEEPPSDGRYDVILDIGGHRSLRVLRRALAPKGTLVIVGSETGDRFTGGIGRSIRAALWSPFVGQRLKMFVSPERAVDLDALRELIEAGDVTPSIERTWPLAETAAAVDHVAAGRARGKVVVTI